MAFFGDFFGGFMETILVDIEKYRKEMDGYHAKSQIDFEINMMKLCKVEKVENNGGAI